ncbi:MAG: hypothetical protein JO126_01155 [Alphaproteobacteria bacterium]|nr:hypothetical protein [Alphaproteobacteria bacterium]MBV8548048.1 hypothetical protein [Alphaproteobacteria bacterium]
MTVSFGPIFFTGKYESFSAPQMGFTLAKFAICGKGVRIGWGGNFRAGWRRYTPHIEIGAVGPSTSSGHSGGQSGRDEWDSSTLAQVTVVGLSVRLGLFRHSSNGGRWKTNVVSFGLD